MLVFPTERPDVCVWGLLQFFIRSTFQKKEIEDGEIPLDIKDIHALLR
jgi:hypothetical protein